MASTTRNLSRLSSGLLLVGRVSKPTAGFDAGALVVETVLCFAKPCPWMHLAKSQFVDFLHNFLAHQLRAFPVK